MYRGTTPTITINVSGYESLEEVKSIEVAIKNNKRLITKNKSEVSITSNCISFMLSQEETLLLDSNYKVQLQVRILTNDDVAIASNTKMLTVEEILKDGVLE